MSLTTDPSDERLTRGTDETPRPQADVYLVLSVSERAKGFVQPVRTAYRHATCGATTTMGTALAETYARDPFFYGGTYCVTCQKHRPLSEFAWLDGEPMDPGAWGQEKLDAVMAAIAEKAK